MLHVPRPARHLRVVTPAVVVALLGLGACGSASGTAARSRAASTRVSTSQCPDLAAATLGGIGRRMYGQAAAGRNVASSVKRLARSHALGAAVAAGDRAAVRAAIAPLIKHQIRRLTVMDLNGRVLARYGMSPSLAPVTEAIRDGSGQVVGHYVLSVSDDKELAEIIRALTGGRVTIGSRAAGATSVSGSAHRVVVAARAFPSGSLSIDMRFPDAMLHTCAATRGQTVADTVGAVGRRLFATESRGNAVQRVLRHVATDARFRRAVAERDPGAVRTAIVRFFRTRSLHVVRIRAVTPSGRLINDVGGPDVLAPASRTVTDAAGRTIGRVTLSVQDDTGYIKLMHRFTGADVLLHRGTGLVTGSNLVEGPGPLPAYRFTARAFPTGGLGVTLLLPPQVTASLPTPPA